MRYFFILFILLIAFQISVFSQTKFSEYRKVNSDEETAYLDNFAVEIVKNDDNKGLFVVYINDDREKLGNILPYVEGVKRHFQFRKISPEKISFVIALGKPDFTRELWIIPKNAEFPEVRKANLSLDNLNEKYLYATRCIDCDPAVPALYNGNINWEDLAKVLKENPNYQLVIDITGKTAFDISNAELIDSSKYVESLRAYFSEKHAVKKRRIKTNINKGNKAETATSAAFYIVPQKTKK